LAIAEKAKTSLGTKIIVTNPSPIQWGGTQNKDDAQLRLQAASMEKLGRQLKNMGLILAYHNHDIELRNAAREFHHMMIGTNPAYVTLCLDAHWVYRGSGNSSVALFDVLKLYGSRITELHLRQSKDNIWTETFCEGDIDYPRLAKYLLEIDIHPHIVLEQAAEKGTPQMMKTADAFRRSSRYTRHVFAKFV
jgi:inosose dehydratase